MVGKRTKKNSYTVYFLTKNVVSEKSGPKSTPLFTQRHRTSSSVCHCATSKHSTAQHNSTAPPFMAALSYSYPLFYAVHRTTSTHTNAFFIRPPPSIPSRPRLQRRRCAPISATITSVKVRSRFVPVNCLTKCPYSM